MNPASLELLFLGTGTSAGVPMIACDCAVCASTDPRDKRHRCSVVVRYAGRQVLVDTTPELRVQALAYGLKRIDALVFTHAHADHVMGLDDVRRFNAVQGGPLDLFADDNTHRALERCFGYALREPDPESRLFRPHLVHRRIVPGEPFDVAGVPWTPVPLMHGALPILGFRVGNLAYCTDTNHIPESSFELLRGLDVFIVDALQWTRHATHFTIEEAIEVARRVGAKRTCFTHIAHGVSHAETSPRLPPGVELAYDGLVVSASL